MWSWLVRYERAEVDALNLTVSILRVRRVSGTTLGIKRWSLSTGFMILDAEYGYPTQISTWTADGKLICQTDEATLISAPPWLWEKADQLDPSLPVSLLEWAELELARH